MADDDRETYHSLLAKKFAADAAWERRVVALRERCTHDEWTGWLTGCDDERRLCLRCMKTMDVRTRR